MRRHYRWRGYYDCIDVDVLPPSAPTISPLPMTSRAMYGESTGTITFQRVDHCQYDRSDFNVFQGNTNDCNRARPTCHFIAPPGQRNTFGQAPEEALRRCQAECSRRPTGKCAAVMVVPRDTPPAVTSLGLAGLGSDARSRQNIPWGVKNCREGCSDQQPAGTSICFGVDVTSTGRDVSEDWLVADDDPEDEVFYSTCYRRVGGRAFDGPAHTSAFPPPPPAWSFGSSCIACPDAVRNANLTSSGGPSVRPRMQVPFWQLANECQMCFRPEVAAIPSYLPSPPPPPPSPPPPAPSQQDDVPQAPRPPPVTTPAIPSPSLPAADLCGEEAAPSTDAAYSCAVTPLAGLTMHYRVDETHLHVQLRRTGANADIGWLALGFPENPGDMLGAIAVIGTPAGSPAPASGRRASEIDRVRLYRLQGYSASAIVPLSEQTLDGPSLTSEGGVMTMRFSKRLVERGQLPIATNGNQRAHLLFAMGGQSAISYHGAGSKATATLTLAHRMPPPPTTSLPSSPMAPWSPPSPSSPLPAQPSPQPSDPISALLGLLPWGWDTERLVVVGGVSALLLLCCCVCCCLGLRCLRRRCGKAAGVQKTETRASIRPKINRLSQRRSTRYDQMQDDACELTAASTTAPPPPPPRVGHDFGLPADWEVATTDEGDQYYFNHQTGQSQWTKPGGGDVTL